MNRILLFITAISCFAFMGTQQLNAQGCFTGWQYQLPITVTNPNATPLSNHQVNVILNTQALISAGKMNVDGSDMRFMTGCCDTLCFWIESGINTATTSVWVNVPSVGASTSATIYMVYGNTGALMASDASCTFDLYEDFDSGSQSSFATNCGAITPTFTGGNMNLSWGSSGIMTSTATFPMANTYTVESDVASATGYWPGLYWYKTSDTRSYAILTDGSSARISVSGSGTDVCDGHNWASSVISYSSPVGLWDLTWVATGDIRSTFPTIGSITSTDVLYAKDSDLMLGFGGISSGSGTLSMNWIRVRKFAEITPTYTTGSEEPVASDIAVDIPYSTINACDGETVVLDAGAGFTYLWSTLETTQTISVTTSGQYFVDAISASSCLSSDTVDVTFEANPVAAFTSSSTNLDAVFTDASTGATSYLWDFGDGGTSTMQNPTHTYATTGTYTVCLIASTVGGCLDTLCSTVVINNVGVNELGMNFFSVYPNPANEFLTVQSSADEACSYSLIDVTGKTILNGSIYAGKNELALENITSGIYIIRIQKNNETFTQRVIIE